MNIELLALLVLFITLAVLIHTSLSLYSMQRIRHELSGRKKLPKAIRNLRLYKMLGLLKIPFERYVDCVPINEIRLNILNCRRCNNIDICDQCLRQGISTIEMDFCPNYQSLLASRKLLSR